MTDVRIPLFPLHVVLFPGASLPLHVFEPRYRTMMADVLGPENAPHPEPAFGIACIREGYEVGAHAETHEIGCFAAVESIRRNPDGTMNLLIRGTSRFRISARPPDDPYPRAEVEPLEEPLGPATGEAIHIALAALDRYVGVVARLSNREARTAALPDDPVDASYKAAALLAVPVQVLQELLESPTASDRLARAAAIARREAGLLETIGPPAAQPRIDARSLN